MQPETFCPKNRLEWRGWLAKHHLQKQSIWLIYHKKNSNIASITWSEAVEEALCFGWIDSTSRPIDDMQFMQFFTRRKAKSVWSKINKEKVHRLTGEGLMAQAGLECIEVAKGNGSWSVLDAVEELKIPKDLAKEFRSQPGSKAYFTGLSKTVKKAMLQWIVLAKRPETRQRRVAEIAKLAARGMRPKQFG